MSAELVDPFAPTPSRGLTPAEADRMAGDIFSDLIDAQFTDPPLPQDLLHKAIHELRRAATYETAGPLSGWAGDVLRALHDRSRSGVPYGEAQEPDWSLDSERRLPQ